MENKEMNAAVQRERTVPVNPDAGIASADVSDPPAIPMTVGQDEAMTDLQRMSRELEYARNELNQALKEKNEAEIRANAAEKKNAAEKERRKEERRAKKDGFWAAHGKTVIGSLFSIVFIAVAVFFAGRALSNAVDAAKTSYYDSMKKTSNAIYDSFYQKSYDYYENAYHTSNVTMINVGDIYEINRLEVLTVRSIKYITSTNDSHGILSAIKNRISDYNYCVAVPGEAVYTVNLKAAEIIIDNENRYVLIRVPSPVARVSIDFQGIEELAFDEHGSLFSKEVEGADEIRGKLLSVQNEIELQVKDNQTYFLSAQKHTESLLRSLVYQFNKGIEDITVDVEFVT